MTMPKSITMTKDGGHYFRAMAFNYAFTIPLLVPVLVFLIIAIINPFWFRNDMFNWVEQSVNKIARWRNYKMYTIYLGTDPELWHGLKD